MSRLTKATPVDDMYFPLRGLDAYAGLSVRRLRHLLHDPAGPLPHYRVGGKILVKRSEYDAWASRFKVSGNATIGGMVDDIVSRL